MIRPHPSTLRSLFRLPPTYPLSLPVRPNHPSDFHLARLLLPTHTPQTPLHVLTPLPPTSLPLPHPSSHIHPLSSSNHKNSSSLRPYIQTALQHNLPHFILSDTPLDRIYSTLFSHAPISPTCPSPDLNFLPQNALTFHLPLAHLPPDTVSTLLNLSKPDTTRLHRLFGDTPIDSLLAHTAHIDATLQSLASMSDALLRATVYSASHWGYLVLRRDVLTAAFNSVQRPIALEALARIVMHISSSHITAQNEQLCRLAYELLRYDSRGRLTPMPKGRTVGGVVMRPATGRFARRAEGGGDAMMICSREPDQEGGSVKGRRLKGNWACLPLTVDGPPVYWDERFVIQVSSVGNERLIGGFDVLMCALQEEGETPDWEGGDLLVRQIRRIDWEMVAREAGVGRGVPYQCVRGLPAIYERRQGEDTIGSLIASPHLGICARPDLVFTAVRVPRIRCLPPDIEPGFCLEHFHGEGGSARAV